MREKIDHASISAKCIYEGAGFDYSSNKQGKFS